MAIPPAAYTPAALSDIRPPFGLPMGSVRAMLSVMICSFFWLTLLWPGTAPQQHPLLGHFFMLGLVMMAFASSPHIREGESSPLLPWLLRLIFVGGTVAAVAVAGVRDVTQLQVRLTPNELEVKEWWVPFLATMGGGFALGLVLRFLMGKTSHVFQSLRSWLSVVGMLMLVVEMVMFVSFAGSERPPIEMIRYWQCVELAVVSAYFGTRA